MTTRPRRQKGWNTLLHRYSGDLVTLVERRRSEAMLALATEQALFAARAETAAAEAEKANHAKDEFLAHISHELRTPLNAIIGFSEMIENQLTDIPEGGKIVDYVRDINASGWHLSRVVNDLLDYAKFEAGKLRLLEEIVDFGQVLQSCYAMVRGRLEEKRIVFLRELGDELPPLKADEVKLKQILINILSNAAKFTPEDGTIAVEAVVTAERCFRIRIRDSGVGIPAEDIGNVFLPFYQLDNQVSRQYVGTGLGLPLTKALVELHGGVVNLVSEPELGTTVTVEFPAERLMVEQPRAADGQDRDVVAEPTGKAA